MTKGPVLVTGGAGFIGGHLLGYLSDLNIPSIVIDNLSTGKLENLPPNHGDYRFIEADVSDIDAIAEAVEMSTLVIHLAAVVGMINVISNPMKTLRTNIDAVRGLAELCSRFGVPLVNISSSAVYRSSEHNANRCFEETDYVHSSGLHPSSAYAESKSIGELICDTFHRTKGLKCLIVRPFNLIGPRQASDYGMVVPRFVRMALNGIPMSIHGDGSQTRTFSDVRQAVRLLWAAIKQNCWDCQVINLATNDQDISILQLARLVSEVVGCSPRYSFVDYESIYGDGFVDIPSRRPSLSALHELIGDWTPVTLSETIAAIVEYELHHLDLEPEATLES